MRFSVNKFELLLKRYEEKIKECYMLETKCHEYYEKLVELGVLNINEESTNKGDKND